MGTVRTPALAVDSTILGNCTCIGLLSLIMIVSTFNFDRRTDSRGVMASGCVRPNLIDISSFNARMTHWQQSRTCTPKYMYQRVDDTPKSKLIFPTRIASQFVSFRYI